MAVFRAGSKLTDLCSIVDSLVSKREQQVARSAADAAAGAGPRYSIERDAALHSALQEHEWLAQPGPRAAATSAAGVPAAKELSRAPLAAALSACPADGIPFWKPVAASAIALGSEPSRDAHAPSAPGAPAAHAAPGLAFTLPPVSVAVDMPAAAAAAIGCGDAIRGGGASPARPDGPAPPRAERARPAPLHPVVRLSPPAIPPGIVPPRQRGPQLASPSSARPAEPAEPAGAAPLLEAPKLAPIWTVDAATAPSHSASPVTVASSRQPSSAAAGAPRTSPRATPPAGPAPAARCSTPEAAQAAGRIAVVGSLHSHKAKLNLQTKQYACEKCGRAFFRRSDYVRHFQIHLGIKPNSCAICGKAFIQRSALNVHVRVHTGEKPYQCSACNRQFSDSSSLARHRRIHARQPAPAPPRMESAAVAARAQRPWP